MFSGSTRADRFRSNLRRAPKRASALRANGIPGVLSWKVLYPVHRRVFRAPADYRVKPIGNTSLS